MKFDFRKLLIGVLGASILSRLYDGFKERIHHEDRNMHEALFIAAIILLVMSIPEN